MIAGDRFVAFDRETVAEVGQLAGGDLDVADGGHDRAATAADRSEQLGRLWKAELAGEARAGVLVKIAAEQRAQDRAVIDLISRVNPGIGAAKSERHARAAQSRWGRSAGA